MESKVATRRNKWENVVMSVRQRDGTSILASAALVFLLAGAGCEDPGDAGTMGEGPPGETARSALAFEDSPEIDAATLAELTAGQIALAADLLALERTPKNQAISPVSIAMAFAMLSAGARGETLAELENALHFPPQERLHRAMNALLVRLRGLDVPPTPQNDGVLLRLVNQIFQERTFTVEVQFLDTLGVHYDAGVQLVDFVNEPEPTRLAINDWVLDQTRDRIANLLPEGSIADDTRLVLVNALYLKAAWQHAFQEADTADGVFHAAGGDVTVRYMRGEVPGARYSRIADVDVVDLPLAGGELAFTVVVPRSGATVDLVALAAQFDTLPSVTVQIHLPRFRVTLPLNLVKALEELGVHALFNESCDLTGINPRAPLWVTGAFHQTFVDVNEKGVEAAAATAIVVGERGAPSETIRVDEPFYFFIRDRSTNAPLFVGFVADPSQSS